MVRELTRNRTLDRREPPSEGTPYAHGPGRPKDIPEVAAVLNQRIIARESLDSSVPAGLKLKKRIKRFPSITNSITCPSATSSPSRWTSGSPPAASERDRSAQGGSATPGRGRPSCRLFQ
jgi:hypothetical protein